MFKREFGAGMLILAVLAGCGPETTSPLAPDALATDTVLPIDPVDPEPVTAEPVAEAPSADETEDTGEDEAPAEEPAPEPTAAPTPQPSPEPTAAPASDEESLPDLTIGDVDTGAAPVTEPKKSFFGRIADGVKGLVQKVKDRFKRK